MRRLVLGPSAEEKARLCPGSTAEECKQLVGHFGRSFQKTRSVDQLLKERFPATFSLALVAAIMWLTMGVPVGVLSAIRPRSLFDRGSTAIVLIGQSLPVYYFGLLGLYFLAYKVKIFPLGGYVPVRCLANPWPWLSHLLLPGITLALPVRGHLRADDARQRARRPVRGLRPDGPRQGRAASAASSSTTRCATRCCRS